MLAVTAVLALGGAALALRLEPSAATETLVDRGSDSFKDTERFKQDFGDEAILVLVQGELTRTVLTADLGACSRLEGCLGGNVPDNKKGLGQPAAGLPRDRGAAPGEGRCTGRARSSTRRSARSATSSSKQQRRPPTQAQQAAEAARRLSKRARRPAAPSSSASREAAARGGAGAVHQRRPAARAASTGSAASRSINDPSFVSALVFDRTAGEPGVPKSRFAYLFPSKNAALIQIRLRPDLTRGRAARARST